MILPESTGALDPSVENWDESRESSVLAGVVAGAQWLIERGPQSPPAVALSFTYHFYSGRLDARAATCTDSFPTCVMRSADLSGDAGLLCVHTARQIGWVDADANGVPDSVQAPPLIQLDPPSQQGNQVTLTGRAQVQAAPNLNPSPQAYTCPITLANLARVEARVDGGAWEEAVPAGEGFSGPQGAFTFQTAGFAPGPHDVEARATDTLGQTQSATASFSVDVPALGPPPIPDGSRTGTRPMMASSGQGETINVWWDASCPAVNVNVYYGFGSGLPAAAGLPYTLAGAECRLGSSGSSSWSGKPNPASDVSRFVWWVLVATDGIQTEGSWGKDSSGQERNGNQASGLGGYDTKDTANPGC